MMKKNLWAVSEMCQRVDIYYYYYIIIIITKIYIVHMQDGKINQQIDSEAHDLLFDTLWNCKIYIICKVFFINFLKNLSIIS